MRVGHQVGSTRLPMIPYDARAYLYSIHDTFIACIAKRLRLWNSYFMCNIWIGTVPADDDDEVNSIQCCRQWPDHLHIYIFLMHFTQLCHSVIHILADGIAVQYVFIYISLASCGNMRAPSTFCISRKICGKFQNAWMLNGFSCDCLAT